MVLFCSTYGIEWITHCNRNSMTIRNEWKLVAADEVWWMENYYSPIRLQ